MLFHLSLFHRIPDYMDPSLFIYLFCNCVIHCNLSLLPQIVSFLLPSHESSRRISLQLFDQFNEGALSVKVDTQV